MAAENFYKAFEDRYRGSRALVKQRLGGYLPIVMPLLKHYPDRAAWDLGCGRGEWLELLTSHGFRARGIDLDEGMLGSCRELGLLVDKAEALESLKRLPGETAAVVSAFHLVEHLPFDAVRQLVSEAYRALVPGGLLILEAPNPENIEVGTRTFYLDPSHQRPIPAELLCFVAEFAGFQRVEVLRLQKPERLRDESTLLGLGDVLSGLSPDYAVVARKWASVEVLQLTEGALSKDYGVGLADLISRFWNQTRNRIGRGEDRLENMQHRLLAVENELRDVRADNR